MPRSIKRRQQQKNQSRSTRLAPVADRQDRPIPNKGLETNMTKIVVVTSGKGGVGKTTTSASFSTGLALRGYKTVVIDFDVGLRNLDLIMGCERRVVYDFVTSSMARPISARR